MLPNRIVRVLWPIRLLRFLLGIEMIEVAEELIKTMHGGQVFILVPEMILAERCCRVTHWLDRLRDGHIHLLQTHRHAWETYFR